MPSPKNPDNPPSTTPKTETTQAEYKAATENLWKTYQTINEWIRFADAKAGALLTVNGVLVAAAVGKMNAEQKYHSGNWLYGFALFFALGCAFYLIASARHCLHCIAPNLKTVVTPAPKKSTIYFEHIAQYEKLNDFEINTLGVARDEAAFKEIAEQVYEVSKVAKQKHEDIIKSVKCLIIGFWFGAGLLWILTGLTLFSEVK